MLSEGEIVGIARYLRERHLQVIGEGLLQVLSRWEGPSAVTVAPCGAGAFLASAVAARLGLEILPAAGLWGDASVTLAGRRRRVPPGEPPGTPVGPRRRGEPARTGCRDRRGRQGRWQPGPRRAPARGVRLPRRGRAAASPPGRPGRRSRGRCRERAGRAVRAAAVHGPLDGGPRHGPVRAAPDRPHARRRGRPHARRGRARASRRRAVSSSSSRRSRCGAPTPCRTAGR